MGMTESAQVGALVGQGSGGAAVGSQAMVDMGLRQYLAGSTDEFYYGNVRVESAAFQDDIAKPNHDVMSAQSGMTRLSAMLVERGLEAHRDKTSYLVCGSKEYKKKTEEQLLLMPLRFGEFNVKRKSSDKYLGQIIHEGGLTESVEATIKERTGKIKGAIYLTKTIIETYEMQGVGCMMAARTLWERAIVPSLLHGAGTWVGSTEETDKLCEELQLLFWRTVLQLPKSTPKVMLRAETRSLQMKQRIWTSKLMLAQSILRRDTSLAKEIYKEQLNMGWTGLSTEVEEICKTIGIKNVNEEFESKDIVEEAIFYHNYHEMKIEINKYEKLEDIKNDDFRELPEYMNMKSLDKVRMAFRIKTKMVKNIKMNYKNSHKNNLACEQCASGESETQCHALTCPGWEEHRAGLDLSSLEDMVTFFSRVLEDKDRKKKEGGQS